jgi:hypothetical protein
MMDTVEDEGTKHTFGDLKMDRAKFIVHKGKEIFIMDCRDASLDEMNKIIEECILQVRKHPEKSVLTLTISGGSAFSGETISKLKEVARDNTPYVKAGAIVGVTGLYKVVFNAVAMFSKRRFYLFVTVDEAMDFFADY